MHGARVIPDQRAITRTNACLMPLTIAVGSLGLQVQVQADNFDAR
jgi:hypothetical protein